MKLWVDGDSCPAEALTAVLDFQRRSGLAVEVAADRALPDVENSAAVMRRFPHGSGKVDEWILIHCRPGDAALTQDLQLARRLMRKGLSVISHRGRIWNMQRLERRIRDAQVMRAMKAGGMLSPQPPSCAPKDTAELLRALHRLFQGSRGGGSHGESRTSAAARASDIGPLIS